MINYSKLRSEFIAHLLSEFPIDCGPIMLEDAAREFLKATYSSESIEKFLEENFRRLQEEIIEETNRRLNEGASLRYTILDDIGEKIAGLAKEGGPDPRIEFQDALNKLTPEEFEGISAVVLKIAGCDLAWKTPLSHDQGLDAFGYAPFFKTGRAGKWLGGKPEVIFLAQAKHYEKEKVSAPELREFVGATILAKYEIYAVQKKKYKQLEVRQFAPLALLYVTSGEIKITAKILAQKAGLVLLSSDELFDVFTNYWSEVGENVNYNTTGFLSQLRKESKKIPIAS